MDNLWNETVWADLQEALQRAERAEAEVARLRGMEATALRATQIIADEHERDLRAEAEVETAREADRQWYQKWAAERALADRLAEALRMSVNGVCGWSDAEIAALVAWEEARRG